MTERKQLRIRLAEAIEEFKANAKEETEANLVNTFISFLEGVDHIQWRSREHLLINEIICLDLRYKFFRLIPESLVSSLIRKPFNFDGLRLYLLGCSGYVQDETKRIALLVDALENDEYAPCRNVALYQLAKLKWPHSVEKAIELWQSKDLSDKQNALDILAELEYENLDEYIREAMQIDCLDSFAQGLLRMRSLRKQE